MEFNNRCAFGESLSCYMSKSNYPNDKEYQLIFEEKKIFADI